MTDTSLPFAEKKFTEVKGHRMAYIDEGEGAPIVFQHGNPTSSYLWRNVMPACRGLGRLIACDLIGMGDSDKLYPSGPDRYTYAEQRDFLFALWDKLGLGNDVVFVVHDWGAALGFDWANRNRDRVQGIAYMEAIVLPLAWDDFPESARDTFRAFRSPAGEDMVLRGKCQYVPNRKLQAHADICQYIPNKAISPGSHDWAVDSPLQGSAADWSVPFVAA